MGWFSRLTGGTTQTAQQSADRVLVLALDSTGPSPAAGAQIAALACVWPDQVGSERSWVVGDAVASGGPTGEVVDLAGLASRLVELMESADLVVAHGAPVAQRFVSALLAGQQLPMPAAPWVCSMRLAKHVEPSWPSFRLDGCVGALGIDASLTDAAARARATAAVFAALRARAGGPDLSELVAIAGLDLADSSPGPASGAEAATPDRAESDGGVSIRYGRGGDMVVELDIKLDIDERLLDLDVPREVKQAILAERRAARQVCGTDRLADLTDPGHRAAHESLLDISYDAPLAERVTVLDALVVSGCPHAGDSWVDLPYRCGSGTKGTFDGRMLVLRAFRDRGFATPDQVRQVAQYLYQVSDIQAGPRLLVKAWRELGPWLAGFAPCPSCGELGWRCLHLDLAYQAAQAIEWGSNEGELLRVAKYLAAPGDAKPALAGRAKEVADLMAEFETASPTGYARLACAVAEAAEKEYPDFALGLYYPNVRSGLAERYEYDRLSLLLERARRYVEAADVAELGLAHPDCGRTRGETLRKRAERCRAKAAAPVKPARAGGGAGDVETLTCVTCGREFNRVFTRGRKPHQCPDCR